MNPSPTKKNKMDKIKEAEEAADSYNVGKEAAKGGTYEQKLNRININHAYKDGYLAGAAKSQADHAKQFAHFCAKRYGYQWGKGNTDYLYSLFIKSKSILND